MFTFLYAAIQQHRGIYGERINEVAERQLNLVLLELLTEIAIYAALLV